MKLREWQAECITLALEKYARGHKHFLVLATPGSGKTLMASSLSKTLMDHDLIDLVICFSPSSVVCTDFSKTLEEVFNERFDGLMGSKGHSLTYQNMQYLTSDFWMLFQRYRVLAIFDEVHHCSGSNFENANVWGEKIILNIQSKAEYTIALTGTPWRSDTAPIVLSNYSSCTSKIQCDYVYGLTRALREGICRLPQIIAIDNDNISVIEKDESKYFSSFRELLSQSQLPYREIIHDESLILHLLEQANVKLNQLRMSIPEAGGLVVASSVEHANQIYDLMSENLMETATVITYREDNPVTLIHQYRLSTTKWVISVGMISEGTNIPRLQVCCHLTNIKTEMHFRQILGRILRKTGSTNEEAFFYMPAEPKLLEYALRIDQDVPDKADIVKIEKMKVKFKTKKQVANESKNKELVSSEEERKLDISGFINDHSNYGQSEFRVNHLTTTYEKMVNIFGRFKQETLDLPPLIRIGSDRT